MRINSARRSHPIDLRSTIVVMLVALAFGLALPSTSYASTLTVCSSGNTCYATIADAVAAASSGDTIFVDEGSDQESAVIDVGLSNSLVLTIEGLGASNTTVNGSGSGPVFIVESGSTVTIQDMTVSGGNSTTSGGGIVNNGTLKVSNAAISNNSSGGNGGGIANYGALTIENSTIYQNSAYFGGGVYSYTSGTVTITGSTFSNNIASLNGGAIYNSSNPSGFPVTITNTTFSGNTAYTYGGAIYNDDSVAMSFGTIASNSASSGGGGGIYNYNGGTATVDNSIIGNNTGGDCAGSALTGAGLNLATDTSCGTTNFTQVSSTSLNLGPLALNSPGTTQTMALISPSSAVNAAPDCNDASGGGVTTDQRGVSRPQGTYCDIGAYELQTSTATSSISTVTDFGVPGASNDSPTGANVTMGAFVHDNATVTTTVDTIPLGSSVIFDFFPTASCSGTPSSTDTEPLNGGTLSEPVESTTQGPLAVGGVSYQATFNSGNTSVVRNQTGVCETVNVQSPIDQFAYTVNSGGSLYTCALESMIGGSCPSGSPEATVGVNTTNNFVVNVEITNLTGMSVVENLEGALAKGKDFSYTGLRTTCGNAIVKNNGAVLWNDSGAHSPNATGFTMNPGDVCDLYVTVTGTFTSTGQQAIASQWSVSQTETSPVSNQSVTVTSQPTESLAVNVQ